jgi:hypothetical protein
VHDEDAVSRALGKSRRCVEVVRDRLLDVDGHVPLEQRLGDLGVRRRGRGDHEAAQLAWKILDAADRATRTRSECLAAPLLVAYEHGHLAPEHEEVAQDVTSPRADSDEANRNAHRGILTDRHDKQARIGPQIRGASGQFSLTRSSISD